MCGISAIKFTTPVASSIRDELESRLHTSLDVMKHRGPDSSGVYVNEKRLLGLAHNRLSIIALDDGYQPLHNDEGTIHAVVSGELYDYEDERRKLEEQGCVFRSSVDSELVVQLYKIHGLNLIHHLRGEFAFVLYDETQQLLFAGRDRFGVKPLYYTLVDGCLMLASEMKSLLPFGWKPEWDLASIIHNGEHTDNRTVFKGVLKLPAAHQLIFRQTGELKIQQYWDQDFPRYDTVETRSVDEMIEGVRSHLVDAVRSRLRSDVPLGVYLSGGIDSATIAGIASSLLKEKDPPTKLATFTLAFPGRSELDEGPIASRMAQLIGADAHFLRPTEEDLVNYFEKSVWHSERAIFMLLGGGKLLLAEYARRMGYKVVLTGEGSDEIFGGYAFFLPDFLKVVDPAAASLGIQLPAQVELDEERRKQAERFLPQDHHSLRNLASGGLNLQSNIGDISGVARTAIDALTSGPEIYQREALREFGNPDPILSVAEGLKPEARWKMVSGQWHPLNAGLYLMSTTFLPNTILNLVGDRTEMGSSLEGRPPFLDHRLVEYVNGLPPSLKIMPTPALDVDAGQPGTWKFSEKWVLRQAARPFVTDEIYRNPKRQYNTPLSLPLPATPDSLHKLTPLQELLKKRVTKANIEKLGWANWGYVHEMLEEYLSSPLDYPADGGLDRRARILLGMLSFIVIQERFQVPSFRF